MKKKKQIAVFHNLPSGGGLRMLENIIERYQEEYGIDIYTISDLPQSKSRHDRVTNTQVTPWSGFLLRNIWILFVLPAFHKKLANHLNRRYDMAFVTHDYFTKSPYLLRYLKIPNIYLCQETQREFYEDVRVHSPKLKDLVVNMLRLPIKYIDSRNVSFAKTIIVNSNYSKREIKRVYNRDSFRVYPGVDSTFFSPGENLSHGNYLLCVGGINPIKDQQFLVTAIRPLLKKYRLILVGKGDRSYINKIIKLAGSKEKVSVMAGVSDVELRELYRHAMVTCITAHNEPFGLSSIESQSCGTPVVAVREGGPTESIINGETGFLSDREPSSYLSKINSAILDRDRMSKISRQNILRNWTWNTTLKKLDMIIK